MWRTALLVLGWIVSSLTLYGALLGLELHWNFFDWLPRLDLAAGGLLLGVLLGLTIIWFLTQRSTPGALRILSLVLSIAFVVLGVYVLSAEPKSEGLFARQSPSPLWYRGARLVVMWCPIAFWVRFSFCSARNGSKTRHD